jgi:hypothetical protein
MSPAGSFDSDEKSGFPAAFAIGLLVVALLVGGLMLVTHSTKPTQLGQAPKLPFGASEQAYAGSIHFQNLEMSESSNLLNQKFTYLNGVISNDGARTVSALEITVEFHDPFNQVILRDAHRVISSAGPPLGPGKQREFQVTFEDVPVEWNRQYPTIRVTGLVLR